MEKLVRMESWVTKAQKVKAEKMAKTKGFKTRSEFIRKLIDNAK